VARGLERIGAPRPRPHQPHLQFIGELSFVLLSNDPDRPVVEVNDVAGWLRQLRSREIERVWLATADTQPVELDGKPVDERVLAAFAGGGGWGLLAAGQQLSEVWRGWWTVTDPNAPDHRIWRVRYQGVRMDERLMPLRPSLDEASGELRAALLAAWEFALANDLPAWAGIFQHAIELGSSGALPPPQPDEDLLPASAYTTEGRRLVAMASRAWVFGGMGSWNDLVFDDDAVQAGYEETAERLYRAVLHGLVAATNSDLLSS
jgi:hypothetical protein